MSWATWNALQIERCDAKKLKYREKTEILETRNSLGTVVLQYYAHTHQPPTMMTNLALRRFPMWYLISTLILFNGLNADEYLNDVLEEAYRNEWDEDMGYLATDEQAMEKEREKEEHERRDRERKREERDLEFETNLNVMDEQQRKIAKAQKRQDDKVVERVLRASATGDLYGVLGLRNFEFTIRSGTIGNKKKVIGWEIPTISFFRITEKAIRQAYREQAKRVHPDRNHDGRAEEAFMTVENAAAILCNEESRNEYDHTRRMSLQMRRTKQIESVRKVVAKSSRRLSSVKKAFGPFAVPVFVVGLIVL